MLFADCSATVLRDLGIDDQVLRAARTIIDKPQLEAFASLLPYARLCGDRVRLIGI